MTSKHTPGPWEYIVRGDESARICEITPEGFPYGWKDGRYLRVSGLIDESDARLIAAAPELLALLMESRRHVIASSDVVRGGLIEEIDAAIAKARGDLAGMWDAIPAAERAELTKAFAHGFAEQTRGQS